jgi:hypothetical protein
MGEDRLGVIPPHRPRYERECAGIAADRHMHQFSRSDNRGDRCRCACDRKAGRLGSMYRHTSITHSIQNPLGVGIILDVVA